MLAAWPSVVNGEIEFVLFHFSSHVKLAQPSSWGGGVPQAPGDKAPACTVRARPGGALVVAGGGGEGGGVQAGHARGGHGLEGRVGSTGSQGTH